VNAHDNLAVAMILEYWFAMLFGRVWLWARPGLRSSLGGTLDRSAAIARGESLPASQLFHVQAFGVRAWSWFAIFSVIINGPVIAVSAIIRPGRWGTEVGGDLLAVFLSLAGVGLGQMILLRYRSDRTRSYIRINPLENTGKLLPNGSPGLPRRSDFWLASVAGALLFAVLIYISSS
jgi:hypothetical protein